jgi:adenylate cyclase class 2
MGEEIEAKVRIEAPVEFRRALEERLGPATGAAFEVNRLFDDAAATLRRQGAALRVRAETDLQTGPEHGRRTARATLTYKGPVLESEFKRRPEHNVIVDSADRLVAVLEAIGLVEVFRYEKRRTAWHSGDCEVTLDELPHIGWFAEVEGPTEKSVRKVLGDVGLSDLPTIGKSYIALLAEHLEMAGLDPKRAVFDEKE